MLRSFLRLGVMVVVVLLIVLLNIATLYLLPYPWNTINVIFALLILLMVIRGTGLVVWLAGFTHLLIELYTITPFGITLYAATMSVLLTFWLYQHFFTNRSWYAAMALAAISLFIYRSLYLVWLELYRAWFAFDTLSGPASLRVFGWEIVMTAAGVGIGYAILTFFLKDLRRNELHI